MTQHFAAFHSNISKAFPPSRFFLQLFYDDYRWQIWCWSDEGQIFLLQKIGKSFSNSKNAGGELLHAHEIVIKQA